MRKSNNYIGTFSMNSDKDKEFIVNLRKVIAKRNKCSEQKKRVVLRGRKPYYQKYFMKGWDKEGTFKSYDEFGNIVGGLKNASVIDVYIYNR